MIWLRGKLRHERLMQPPWGKAVGRTLGSIWGWSLGTCTWSGCSYSGAASAPQAPSFLSLPVTCAISWDPPALSRDKRTQHFPLVAHGASSNFADKRLHPSFDFAFHFLPSTAAFNRDRAKQQLFSSLFCTSPAVLKTNWIFHYCSRLRSSVYFSCNFHVCLLIFLMRLKALDKRW